MSAKLSAPQITAHKAMNRMLPSGWLTSHQSRGIGQAGEVFVESQQRGGVEFRHTDGLVC